MHRFLLALLAALVAIPATSAHVPSTPIEAEDHWLQDEWTDNGVWDGFDILDVHVREAHFDGLGDGLVVRWSLYGGSSVGYITEHVVRLDFSNAQSVAWTSTDNGQSWVGPGEVLDVVYDPEDDIPVVNIQFQGFVPYSALGVAVGGSLDGAVATATADDLVVDTAPGGYHLYGVEITDPTAAPESLRLIDSLVLDGPDRYTQSNLTYTDGVLTVNVTNPVHASGQHLRLLLSEQADVMHVVDNVSAPGAVLELGPGQGVVFTAPVTGFSKLRVDLATDLGGLETWWVGPDGTLSRVEPMGVDVDEGEQPAPGLPVAFVAAALALLVARRRG